MKFFNLKSFIGGWFAGNFDPTIIKTTDFEVCVKRYGKGDHDKRHLHKKADEITVIVQGSAKMNGKIYKKDDIILIEKNEATDFESLEDGTVTCVVKRPSVIGDKYET